MSDNVLTKEEIELLNWKCPKDCPNRGAKELNGRIVSCHYICEQFIKVSNLKNNQKRIDKNRKEIDKASYSYKAEESLYKRRKNLKW